jgi:hypothetical protein
MDCEGPSLEALLRRLVETPAEFLAEPRIGRAGQIEVAAVVADLCRLFGSEPASAALAPFKGRDRNRLAVTLIACWLLADDAFRNNPPPEGRLLELLASGLAELAAQTPSQKFVEDPARREELARNVLAGLGLRPLGETREQAEDRLTSLNAAERARVVAAARAAEERARKVREALARKAAEESADKWTRE